MASAIEAKKRTTPLAAAARPPPTKEAPLQ